MMFGREVTLPVDLLLGSFPDINQESSEIVYLQNLKEKLGKIHEIARENLEKSSDKQKRVYDHRANAKSYNVGDTVFLFDPSKQKGISPKLQSRWAGPYSVMGKLSDLLYKIQLNPQSKIKVVHHDRLKLGYGKVVTSDNDRRSEIVRDSGTGVTESSNQGRDNLVKGHDNDNHMSEVVNTCTVTTRSGRKVKLPKKFQD